MANALGPSLWVVEPENGLFGKPYEYAKAAQKTVCAICGDFDSAEL